MFKVSPGHRLILWDLRNSLSEWSSILHWYPGNAERLLRIGLSPSFVSMGSTRDGNSLNVTHKLFWAVWGGKRESPVETCRTQWARLQKSIFKCHPVLQSTWTLSHVLPTSSEASHLTWGRAYVLHALKGTTLPSSSFCLRALRFSQNFLSSKDCSDANKCDFNQIRGIVISHTEENKISGRSISDIDFAMLPVT